MPSGEHNRERGGRRRDRVRPGHVDHRHDRYLDERGGGADEFDEESGIGDHDLDDEFDERDTEPADDTDGDPDHGTDEDDDRYVGLPAQVAARNGLRHIAELTGKTVTGVTSLHRSEHGWTIGVEVVEDRRIPSSADILAVYQTDLDDRGELLGYRRTRRYPRGRGDSRDERG
ncbi:gas vesicle protein GvpO [Plantactinospora sonchi]|uniref:Gas vesicle protein GvpO n=1 Tax=Plantactinospora sonchi TaxID=1544735 RepID=A0ABU7RRM1_9ACTN